MGDDANSLPVDRRRLIAGALGVAGVGAAALTGCGSATRASASGSMGPSAAPAPFALPTGRRDGLPNTEPNEIADLLTAQKVLPVLRDPTVESAVATARAWAAAGCRVVELTTSTPEVESAVRTLVGDGLTVGVGTIRMPEQVGAMRDAGARFVVSFATFQGFLDAAVDAGLTAIPGTMTPTETLASLSAPIIKIAPAGTLGPDYMAFLRVVFPGIRAVATGGIPNEAADARAWLAAGAIAVGMSGDLGGDALTLGRAPVVDRIQSFLAAVRG